VIKIMEANHTNQLSIMQNYLIQEEKSSINTFQPWTDDIWQKNDLHQDQRFPSQLEITSMDKHEDPPCYRACEDFHEEPTCSSFQQMNEEELPEEDNAMWSDFLIPFKEDKIEESCNLSIPDHFEQWQTFNSNSQVLRIIKNLQRFKVSWNKEHKNP
jgi:hypothetical protein